MSKKSFSVWPDIDNSPMPESLRKVRERSSAILTSSGFSDKIYSTWEPFDEYSELLFKHKSPTKKFYANWSDYIRLCIIEEELLNDNEVLYYDCDFLILQPPTSYGCALETHLQSEIHVDNIVKYWFRGVNCAYYLNPQYMPQFNSHITKVREYIKNVQGRVRHTYPMNFMAPIEEDIGYIRNYFLFGSIYEPMFCTVQKIYRCIIMYAELTGIHDMRIDGMNLMGSRIQHNEENNKFIEDQITTITSLNKDLSKSVELSVSELFQCIQKCRIRPNYGSLKIREKIKEAIKHYGLQTT